MITPRQTRLVRVPDLHAFRHALVSLCRDEDAERARSRLVIVPTRGAARLAERTVARTAARGAASTTRFVTREEFYDALYERLTDPPPRLSTFARDAMMQAAARESSPSVSLRPGLVAEMLRFYDQLRRQGRSIARFQELLDEALSRDAEYDRGAERMLAQARILAATFHGYERRVAGSEACDEHVLRAQVLDSVSLDPIRAVIVTTGDWIADPSGLFLADFDLLTRLPGLEHLDVVATEELLAAGFHERVHEWLPGIEEVGVATLGAPPSFTRPLLMVPSRPPGGAPDAAVEQPCFVVRDREEELIAVARRLAPVHQNSGEDSAQLERVAVVFKRPLPYLYLVREVFGGAGIPYQTSDTLPLAAEPFAAALELVFEFVESGFTRASLVALLLSPHFLFEEDGKPIDREGISALDRFLARERYLGGLDRLTDLASRETPASSVADRGALHRALRVGERLARKLSPLATPAVASGQLRMIITFLDDHVAAETPGDPFAERTSRARAAVRQTLVSLEQAHAAYDDAPVGVSQLAVNVRRWIEEQTFADLVMGSGAGVHLVDDQAARYGDFDDINLVGVIEHEWPERPRRNIFYPAALLTRLGWPSEQDRSRAAQARFVDLLASASRHVSVFTVTLDDEALVEPSVLIEDIALARLSTVSVDEGRSGRVFIEEALSLDPLDVDGLDHTLQSRLDPGIREWAAMRLARSSAEDPAFHGRVGTGLGTVSVRGTGPRTVQGIGPPIHRNNVPETTFSPPVQGTVPRTVQGPGPRTATRPWSVSALETYLDCPFKFFARHVLRLEEEPEDEEVMDPRREGTLVHRVFEAFFRRWQARGHQTITAGNLATARTLFVEVVDECLADLSETEAALARTRLLGSPAAAGLGEAVLRMEAERPVPVVDRRLEYELKGDFVFSTADGPRTLPLRGKADRVDLLADGTFRLIDYKLGWPPTRSRALQLPIYSICAEQMLDSGGRRWTLGEAAYLAFKGPKRVVPLVGSRDDRGVVLAEAQQRLVDTVDAIARGEFPPRPDDVFRCETCSYAAVCRKDYVGDV